MLRLKCMFTLVINLKPETESRLNDFIYKFFVQWSICAIQPWLVFLYAKRNTTHFRSYQLIS